jgi:hypothetical protein
MWKSSAFKFKFDSILYRQLSNPDEKRLLTFLRRATLKVAFFFLRIIPVKDSRSTIVITGLEENGIEFAKILKQFHYQPNILVDSSEIAMMVMSKIDNVKVVKKNTLHGFYLWVTSRNVAFTHGAFSSPKPWGGRYFLNLWHGDGPKTNPDLSRSNPINSSIILSAHELWGRKKAQNFHAGEAKVFHVYNPRCLEFLNPARDFELEKLGIDPSIPFVVWMPTWRRDLWSSAHPSIEGFNFSFDELYDLFSRSGFQFVVKTHPLDHQLARIGSFRNLDKLGTLDNPSLYSFLAKSSGLISDYSSVVTDYEVLGKPIGYLCADMEVMLAKKLIEKEFVDEINSHHQITDLETCSAFINVLHRNREKNVSLDYVPILKQFPIKLIEHIEHDGWLNPSKL